jgi:hypothetical protein
MRRRSRPAQRAAAQGSDEGDKPRRLTTLVANDPPNKQAQVAICKLVRDEQSQRHAVLQRQCARALGGLARWPCLFFRAR